MDMISPGVYSQIYDLSQYMTATTGTVGFVPIISEKGPDNVLTRVTDYTDYVQKFGEPDIRTFGKYYGMGPYIAQQHLSVSNDLYVIRALPDDATYSHLFIYYGEVKDYPFTKYRFDELYKEVTIERLDGETDVDWLARTAALNEFKYGDQNKHVSLGGFSVEAGIEYTKQAENYCKDTVENVVDLYLINPDYKEIAATKGYGWKDTIESESECDDIHYEKTSDPNEVKYTSCGVFAADTVSRAKVADGTVTKLIIGYVLNESERDEAFNDEALFDVNGVKITDSTMIEYGVITSKTKYASKAITGKINNTQKLDSFFVSNDSMITSCINANVKYGQPELYSNPAYTPHKDILGYIRAVGRGSYYNDYCIKITSDSNPATFGQYKFQILQLIDGIETIVESYNVAFDPTALDGEGESLYWVDVINRFSTVIHAEANENALPIYTKELVNFYQNDPTIEEIAKDYVYTVNVDGELVEVRLTGDFPPSDQIPHYDEKTNKVECTTMPSTVKFGYKARLMWEAYYSKAWAEKKSHDANIEYSAALEMDDDNIEKDTKIIEAIKSMTLAQNMTASAENFFSWASAENYMELKDCSNIEIGEQPFYLQNGTLGSIVTSKGTINANIGDQILCYAYTGLLKNPEIVKIVDESLGSIKYVQKYTEDVYDTDWVYFSIVYDAGYKPNVKDAARTLCQTYRQDCVLISDCCDNATYEDCLKYVGAVKSVNDCHIWSTYYAARYEPYSKIYDAFTTKDIWVTPVYHMARLIPECDNQYGIWYAPAGKNRGLCSSIKQLRYSANKSQRDLLYQAQVNPIVYFPEGMLVWGQLTTQKETTAMSDLNCVRTVLYIKRNIEQYCKNFIFDHNTSTTHESIKRSIDDFLQSVLSKGGLNSFDTVVGATDYEYKTKTCHINVTLSIPKVLEKIQINFYVA